MRIAFTQPWEGHLIGHEIDVHPTIAMYLNRVRLARFVDEPHKVTKADLFRPVPHPPGTVIQVTAENAVADPAPENADARPGFYKVAGGYSGVNGPPQTRLPKGGTGQSGGKRKRSKQ